MGAWIETRFAKSFAASSAVAPVMGAWIETLMMVMLGFPLIVAPVMGAWIETSKALTDHVDEEDKLNNESLSSLGQRGGWLINESGLYSLILSSKLPTAKRFKRWVTAEVLPTLSRCVD